jgi:hypothetical protein
VARKSRQSFLKRLKEVKRMEKAALKRQRRLARKQGIDPATETRSEDGHDPGEPRPTVVLAPPPEDESKS